MDDIRMVRHGFRNPRCLNVLWIKDSWGGYDQQGLGEPKFYSQNKFHCIDTGKHYKDTVP